MPFKPSFVQQSRDEIARSTLNNSNSKQLWTFSKTKRFQNIKTECPVAFYQPQVSTLATRKAIFQTSKRKLFTQTTDAPLPGTYQPQPQIYIRGAVFGQSRDKCAFLTYVSRDSSKIPGPNHYQITSLEKRKGYTLRPKTANHRNYFIDDKERQLVPSAFQYCVNIQKQGRTVTSKFKSTVLGSAGIRRTQPRFTASKEQSPGPSSYHPRSLSLKRHNTGGAIGNELKISFIDRIRSGSYQPGPGNYQFPTQFAHYKPIQRSLSLNRVSK